MWRLQKSKRLTISALSHCLNLGSIVPDVTVPLNSKLLHLTQLNQYKLRRWRSKENVRWTENWMERRKGDVLSAVWFPLQSSSSSHTGVGVFLITPDVWEPRCSAHWHSLTPWRSRRVTLMPNTCAAARTLRPARTLSHRFQNDKQAQTYTQHICSL